jgi:hypothetical protein
MAVLQKVMAITIQYENFLQVIDDYDIFVPKTNIQLCKLS